MMLAAIPCFAQAGPNSSTMSSASAAATLMTEQVSIKSVNTALPGIIENVAGNDKHAAVLIVADGDAKSVATARKMAKLFAAHGIVALTYEAANATTADASAAADVLRHRGDVMSDKIGIMTLGSASSVIADVTKSQSLRYAIAIDKSTNPDIFSDMSQKVLLVRPTDDAFSDASEKTRRTAEKHNKNLTFWLSTTDDANAITNSDSALLGRVLGWATDRSA